MAAIVAGAGGPHVNHPPRDPVACMHSHHRLSGFYRCRPISVPSKASFHEVNFEGVVYMEDICNDFEKYGATSCA